MSTEPLSFLRDRFVSLFNEGVAAHAAAGDERSKATHADIIAARGASRFVLEGKGGGEVFLAVENGAMRALDSLPAGMPVRMAVAMPVEAARAALEQIENEDLLSNPKAAKRIALTASRQTEQALEGHTLEFHLTITDLPAEPEEVTLRIALGASEPPANPKFSATVGWDDIEDLRAGDLTPQQLFGRLKLKGDASQAMAIGMALMQRR